MRHGTTCARWLDYLAPAACGMEARGELAGFDSFIICTATALLAAVRHPAPAGCGAVVQGELAGFDSSIICTLWATVRHPAPAGCGAATLGELAGFDNSIICTLRAAVRHPAPAGCGAATRGELAGFDNSIILYSTGRRPASGSGRVWAVGMPDSTASYERVPESRTHFACLCPKFREARTSAHNQVRDVITSFLTATLRPEWTFF
jgi:hypothetical protein